MIDIHCHILPGLDDGPESLHETIAMAKTAADDGIDTIIATPHHNNGKYINERQDILGVIDFVNAQIKRQGIELSILPGQEIHFDNDIIKDLKRRLLLPLNQSTKYVLIDLPGNHLPPSILSFLFDLQLAGYIPVIAHPERNTSIASDPDILYELVKNGALIQVDATSVTGHNGKKVKKFTEQMIKAGMVHFLASNAHNKKHFRLDKAYQALDDTTVEVLIENSEQLVHDEPVTKDIPRPIKKSGIRKIFH